MRDEFEKNGFVTLPFSQDLKSDMLRHIHSYIHMLGSSSDSIENVASIIPDDVWQKKMGRCFRIFPNSIADRAFEWAQRSICKQFGTNTSAVNVVLPEEVVENPKITEDHLAIYWRSVRPGKSDAGRPHRDASFWDLEIKEGYNPKIPFAFDYMKNCIKIWIPLAGCNQNTTLRVIPGSHKMDVPTTIEQTECGRRPSICPKWLSKHQTLFMSPIELSKDHCILFDMNLVHMGPRHDCSSVRISAEFNFITK